MLLQGDSKDNGHANSTVTLMIKQHFGDMLFHSLSYILNKISSEMNYTGQQVATYVLEKENREHRCCYGIFWQHDTNRTEHAVDVPHMWVNLVQLSNECYLRHREGEQEDAVPNTLSTYHRLGLTGKTIK